VLRDSTTTVIAGDTVSVAGVLLAAGGSRRLGSPKQLLTMHGVTLVERAARQLLDAGCSPVLVVVGAHADEIRDAVSMLSVTCVENGHWERGMGTSIAAAVTALHDARFAHTSAVLIATCDMPTVTVEHLQSLLATSNLGAQRVASAYAGPDGNPEQGPVRGIPAALPRADWPVLAALDGDQGARALLRDAGTITVSLPNGHLDLDTPSDVAEWRTAGGTSLM
jgi:CTP:molybdopterin cytidylyltransferase MocA